jgi:hypothetical protein
MPLGIAMDVKHIGIFILARIAVGSAVAEKDEIGRAHYLADDLITEMPLTLAYHPFRILLKIRLLQLW